MFNNTGNKCLQNKTRKGFMKKNEGSTVQD